MALRIHVVFPQPGGPEIKQTLLISSALNLVAFWGEVLDHLWSLFYLQRGSDPQRIALRKSTVHSRSRTGWESFSFCMSSLQLSTDWSAQSLNPLPIQRWRLGIHRKACMHFWSFVLFELKKSSLVFKIANGRDPRHLPQESWHKERWRFKNSEDPILEFIYSVRRPI